MAGRLGGMASGYPSSAGRLWHGIRLHRRSELGVAQLAGAPKRLATPPRRRGDMAYYREIAWRIFGVASISAVAGMAAITPKAKVLRELI